MHLTGNDKGLYATMNRWRIAPSYFPVSLIFPQPARTYRLGEFHEMLWSQQRLKLRGIEAGTGFLHARQIAVTQNGLDGRKLTVKTEDEKLHRLLLGWRAGIRNATTPGGRWVPGKSHRQKQPVYREVGRLYFNRIPLGVPADLQSAVKKCSTY